MGTTYKFKCENCGFSIEVSGGKDRGKRIATITIICERCNQMADVIVSNDPSEFTRQYWMPPKQIICPECNSHLTKPWAHPGPCPKCGRTMERLKEVAAWD